MQIQTIYEKYEIPKHLQLHMLRVAWVCKLICDHRTGGKINKDHLIQASLLHDMWNIVKFTFDEKTSALLLKGMNIEKLKKNKAMMIEKYGSNDHDANILICKELWVSKDVIELVDAIDFLSLHYLEPQSDMEKILMIYCDLRTWPFGVTSTHERLREAALRYKKSKRVERLESSYKLADTHENKIFQQCTLDHEEITEELVKPLINDLRKYEIHI